MNRHMGVNGSVSESVEGNEKYLPVNKRKEDPRYIVAENLTELRPTVVWEAELVNDGIRECSKHCVEGVACVFLPLAVKHEKEDVWRRSCLNKKEERKF